MKKKSEIRIAGFGGQGIILAGYVIGKAAAIYDNKFSTLIQSFGPEARGSSCVAQVIIADSPILYPYLIKPNVSVILSQEAFEKFGHEIDAGGLMLIEKDLVQMNKPPENIRIYTIPATRMAEEIGRKIVMNIITVGFFTSISGLISYDGSREAISSSVPKGLEEINLKAFNAGYDYGKKLLETSTVEKNA